MRLIWLGVFGGVARGSRWDHGLYPFSILAIGLYQAYWAFWLLLNPWLIASASQRAKTLWSPPGTVRDLEVAVRGGRFVVMPVAVFERVSWGLAYGGLLGGSGSRFQVGPRGCTPFRSLLLGFIRRIGRFGCY
jgi:hypothetical protein